MFYLPRGRKIPDYYNPLFLWHYNHKSFSFISKETFIRKATIPTSHLCHSHWDYKHQNVTLNFLILHHGL
jgi:hypothetical protein